MNNLATVCFHQGRYEEAEAHWKRALGIYEELGSRHQFALMLNNYARLMRKTGRKSDAKKLEARARAISSGSRPNEWDRFTVDVNDLLPPRR
jgi:tetratricopeptide (TPR) repeat protein